MPKYSIVIPVYNRPQEIRELLESLTYQEYQDFEVIIVEDGSDHDCKEIIKSFSNQLNEKYFFKDNSGQGFSRNYGFDKASGKYLIVFDSDCLIPPHYLTAVESHLKEKEVDCWGGPDKAHNSFTSVQKAINYSMTSPLTTGGIRGNKAHIGRFTPRSFNMGISKEVFEKTGGYIITRMGEDIEFSLRIEKEGFSTDLIEDAYVFHKRRTNLSQFFKQLHFFGRARINIGRFFPSEIKPVHFLPSLFFIGFILSIIGFLFALPFISYLIYFYFVFAFLIFFHALMKEKNFTVALISIATSFIQLLAYGMGFIEEWWKRGLKSPLSNHKKKPSKASIKGKNS